MTPGSNLFLRASRLIRRMSIDYFQYSGRIKNEARQWVSSFGPAITIQASVQSVPRSRYQNLGLDFNKKYINVFAAIDAIDLQRDSSGDQFAYGGEVYQIEAETSWFLADGWVECLAVKIGRGTQPILVAPVAPPAGA